jgi:hypothetical protein
MKKIKYLSLTLFICILLGVLILYFVITKDHVLYKAVSPDEKYTAQVVWERGFPFFVNFSAFLIISDIHSGRELLRQPLLQNRDALIEIKLEFTGISWVGHEVIIHVDPENNYRLYDGPTTFKIEGIKVKED